MIVRSSPSVVEGGRRDLGLEVDSNEGIRMAFQ